MYHRLLNIFVATRDARLERALRAVSPQRRFSHEFHFEPDAASLDLKKHAIIVLDFEAVSPGVLEQVRKAKDDALVVGCFTESNLSLLAGNSTLFDKVWVKPLSDDELQFSFSGILQRLRRQEDAMLDRKYLETLIDSLPDLVWFKDIRGAHLKVNNSFCRAVDKTKEQIEGRGHYYIWDLEPDEYAQGEYICLESEEIVHNKKETCLFDETVKCGDELRKFKTYKSPVFDDQGNVMGTVGFAHDVTDLQNLMIELNILIESLPFAVMVTDKSRVVTSVNQKFIDIFQLGRSELIGKTSGSFLNESKTVTRSKRWIIESEDDSTFFLSRDRVLQFHDETLRDVFGAEAGHVYLFWDVTLERRNRNKLLIDAKTDYLTKLNNRRSLHSFMSKTPCHKGTVLFLTDLDDFKAVNDRYGHVEGDKVLVAFAELLQESFPPESLFRLGGDEFAVILHDVKEPSEPEQCAQKLGADFRKIFASRFHHTDVSLSIGIAMDADGTSDFGELFKKADMALYDSKKAGKNSCTFWGKPPQNKD